MAWPRPICQTSFTFTPPPEPCDLLLLDVPRSRLKTRGDRAFAVAAPRLWNSLPPNIRAAKSLDIFKSLVKTHLFSLALDGV